MLLMLAGETIAIKALISKTQHKSLVYTGDKYNRYRRVKARKHDASFARNSNSKLHFSSSLRIS